MKLRTILIVVASAGMATSSMAQPQISATVTLNWKNSVTGDQTMPRPGESAILWLDVAFTPPVGTLLVTPLGTGTVAGLGSLFIDLIGSGDPEGSWRSSGVGFGGTPNIDGPFTNTNFNNLGRRNDLAGGWALGGVGGQGGGVLGGTINDYMAGQAGQLPLVLPANQVNPVREIFRTEWTPSDYSARVVTFQSRRAAASTGTGISLLLVSASEVIIAVPIPAENITWGSALVMIPSPSGFALLMMAGCAATRRRR